MDSCGLTQLASRTVGVPFVGRIAAKMVIAQLLRRLQGATRIELATGSVAALDYIEIVTLPRQPYAGGHVSVDPMVVRF